ncbi:MAG: tRNA (adenosine(37)-N6)-dimethylallyltransferase MiaA [Burkholderiales bacterium]
MGPTASGKSAIALAISAHLPVEIVSVDSAQVYRGMDVGTAKPSRAEREAVPHHLIDLVDPTESYSAARFREDAVRVAREIAARGRVPLLVGGTMLYFKALAEGLSELPAADATVRADIDAEARARGWPALHAELARVDPVTARRLESSDAQRIQRALEVHRLTGEPMSTLLAARRERDTALDLVEIALVPSDRTELHRRIAVRFQAMLANGLVDELAGLRERHALHARLPSMRCVGYRQAWEHLEGTCSRDELRDRGIVATRQLAKRQLTWLRSWSGAIVFDAFDPLLAPKVHAAIGPALDR